MSSGAICWRFARSFCFGLVYFGLLILVLIPVNSTIARGQESTPDQSQLIPTANPAAGLKRVALVIGNSDYQVAPDLKNPHNDASALAITLEHLQFEVTLGLDLDAIGMRKQIQKFVGRLDENTVAVFFYAGHGLQVNGTNYLVPVDANLASISDLEFEAVRFDLLLLPMEQTATTAIIFLDACRDNPLAEKLSRSAKTRSLLGRGLAPIQSGAGLFIGFATQPDNVAADGAGDNSPFTTALLRYLVVPDLDVEMMMRKVRDEVISNTGRAQIPWSNSSLSSAGFVFNPTRSVQQPVEMAPAAPASLAPAEGQLELEFWKSISTSEDPALFDAYLRRYPRGTFSDIAAAKAKQLRKNKSASVNRSEGGPTKKKNSSSPKETGSQGGSTTKKKAVATTANERKESCRQETHDECRQRARSTGKQRGYCRNQTNRRMICN